MKFLQWLRSIYQYLRYARMRCKASVHIGEWERIPYSFKVDWYVEVTRPKVIK